MPAVSDLTGATPVEIDSALAEIYTRVYRAEHKAQQAREHLSSTQRWRFCTEQDIARAQAGVTDAEAKVAQIRAETTPYDAEFSSRGGWTRAFLVTSSSEGHVHSTTACSTCRVSTQFIWLPDYSGGTEDAIVADAGERACTTCYPTAPVEVRERPTKIFSPDERAAAQARVLREQALAERRAQQAVKAITRPNGSQLHVDGWGEVKTERTAQTLYIERAADAAAFEQGLTDYRPRYASTLPELLAALAHKRGVSPDQVRTDLEKKVAARVKRDWL